MKNEKQTIKILACLLGESLMTGVAYFILRGKTATAVYTDNSKESAEIAPELIAQWEMYHDYQNGGNGPDCEAPNVFALVSAIQSKRAKTT